ncbi:MAG: substrate-binding domain-containing protein [Clostridia bacterium]
MKKLLALMLSATVMGAMLVGCSSTSTSTTESSSSTSSSSASTEAETTVATATGLITVITREDGSGTRGAFTEITGVDDGDGDRTTVDANVQSSTGAVMTSVAGDAQAIGYISLGSLNDTVKALEVDGVYPSVETILDGSYTVARPFNIATLTGADLNPVAEELMSFIFTQEAQDIAADEGYIPVTVTTENFESAQPSGTITVGGSTSVYPLMEKFVEAYAAYNPNATINLEGVGSSSGMSGAADGTFDIGMASRNMKDSETAVLTGLPCAMDGIAVIVNSGNPTDGLSLEQIMNIYIGEITNYDQLS